MPTQCSSLASTGRWMCSGESRLTASIRSAEPVDSSIAVGCKADTPESDATIETTTSAMIR